MLFRSRPETLAAQARSLIVIDRLGEAGWCKLASTVVAIIESSRHRRWPNSILRSAIPRNRMRNIKARVNATLNRAFVDTRKRNSFLSGYAGIVNRGESSPCFVFGERCRRISRSGLRNTFELVAVAPATAQLPYP